VSYGRIIDTISELCSRLEACCTPERTVTSKLLPIGLITSFLSREGVTPVVYGGTAVEYYTSGSHESSDVDLLCTNPRRLKEVLLEIGFRQEVDFFYHDSSPVPIQLREDVDAELDHRNTVINVEGYEVRIITVEQTILDYTHKFVENGANLEPVFVADLIEDYQGELSFERLLERARAEFDEPHYHVLRALIAVKAQQYFYDAD
jgi:predicted nucleotidyltransferase